MKGLVILISCWALTTPFSATRADEPSATFTEVTVQGHKGYIISEKDWSDMKVFFTGELGYGNRFSGNWTPTADDVVAAEKAAWKLVEETPANPVPAFAYLAHCKPEDKDKSWKDAENEAKLVNEHRGKYEAQYIGVVVDGKKQIFCNFYVLGNFIEPSKRIVYVNDGGYSYWQVLYDTKADRCSSLQINGPWELDW